jgi:glucan phosphorylase
MRPSTLSLQAAFADKLSSTASTTATAAAAAAATTATATTVVELTVAHWRRKRQQQHHHQHTSCRTIVNTFTSPWTYLTYLQYLMFSDYQVVSIKNTQLFSRSTYS